MRSANCRGVISERSRPKGSSSTASIPVSSSKRNFSGVGVSSFNPDSGRRIRAGCGSKVTATALAPLCRARATISRSTCAWARWTPSKLPTLTRVGPKSAGTSSSLWNTCIKKDSTAENAERAEKKLQHFSDFVPGNLSATSATSAVDVFSACSQISNSSFIPSKASRTCRGKVAFVASCARS